MNEKAYLKEIRKGNQEALNAFIEALYPSVYRYVFCKVSGKEEAKDITQEVFLRFIKQIHNYRSDGKVLAYLYTIAMNCCHTYYRKEKRFDYTELNDEISKDDYNLSEDVLHTLSFEELRLFLQKLPDKDQDILIFHYLKQMTFKEISQITNESENTLKTRHYRALAKMKKLIKDGDQYVS